MITKTSSNVHSYLETTSIKNLTDIVQKAGIPLNSEAGQQSRFEALTFIVTARRERDGEASWKGVAQLIQEISQIATQSVGRAACEVSWRIHQEVAELFDYKVKQLGQNNQEYKPKLHAIHDLYKACKSQNSEKYQRGEEVNFAGVPKEFIYLESISS